MTRPSICIPTAAAWAHAQTHRAAQLVKQLPRTTTVSGPSSWPQAAARASPLLPMLPHSASPLPPLDAEHKHERSVGANDRALSASSTPPHLGGERCASSPERLLGGREAAAAWFLCMFIAALVLAVTSGLHNREPPAATVTDKTTIRWHIRCGCTQPLPRAERSATILEPW